MITGITQKTALKTGTKNQPSKGDQTSFAVLKHAAVKAFRTFGNKKGKCHRTAEQTAKNNGAIGNDNEWQRDTSYRDRPLLALKTAINKGDLKPGMVIYANKRPGTDPQSLNMKNGPHWFTYLGKDAAGVDRFSDQYSTEFTLDRMNRFIPGRKIDTILDPYAKKRTTAVPKLASDTLELSIPKG